MLSQKPFLDGAEHLTEDVVSVFPAADSLEQYIIALITSACEEETAAVLCKRLSLYQVIFGFSLDTSFWGFK